MGQSPAPRGAPILGQPSRDLPAHHSDAQQQRKSPSPVIGWGQASTRGRMEVDAEKAVRALLRPSHGFGVVGGQAAEVVAVLGVNTEEGGGHSCASCARKRGITSVKTSCHVSPGA